MQSTPLGSRGRTRTGLNQSSFAKRAPAKYRGLFLKAAPRCRPTSSVKMQELTCDQVADEGWSVCEDGGQLVFSKPPFCKKGLRPFQYDQLTLTAYRRPGAALDTFCVLTHVRLATALRDGYRHCHHLIGMEAKAQRV